MKKIIYAALICCFGLPLQAVADSDVITTLIDELGLRESAIASRDMPGWSRPSKITYVVFRELPASGQGSADWVREVTDGVEVGFVNASDGDLDFSRLADSDVYVGWCYADAITAVKKLKYMHILSAGMERCTAIPGILESQLITTNSAKAASETIAEHSIAMMLMLTRNLHAYHKAQMEAEWLHDAPARPAVAVQGKTMLVLGLGGIGSQVARRAHDLGMRVIGTRNSSRSGPDYVDYVGLSNEMNTLAAQADVVVNALPLTPATRAIVNANFFDSMRDGAYYISVGRGGTTDTDALLAALLSGKLNGAGLDVTDPEPLPEDHPLWAVPNVIITPHTAATSDRSIENTWIIAKENLRRYIRGEKLLNLVDLERGY